jgi:hypothetical protein
MNIDDVLKRHESALLKLPNAVGIAIGEANHNPVIKVLVTKKVPKDTLKPEEIVPSTLEGYVVKVQEVGIIEAQ